MYLLFKNGKLYKYVYSGMTKSYFAVTHFKEKCIDGFNPIFNFYEKEIGFGHRVIRSVYFANQITN